MRLTGTPMVALNIIKAIREVNTGFVGNPDWPVSIKTSGSFETSERIHVKISSPILDVIYEITTVISFHLKRKKHTGGPIADHFTYEPSSIRIVQYGESFQTSRNYRLVINEDCKGDDFAVPEGVTREDEFRLMRMSTQERRRWVGQFTVNNS